MQIATLLFQNILDMAYLFFLLRSPLHQTSLTKNFSFFSNKNDFDIYFLNMRDNFDKDTSKTPTQIKFSCIRHKYMMYTPKKVLQKEGKKYQVFRKLDGVGPVDNRPSTN